MVGIFAFGSLLSAKAQDITSNSFGDGILNIVAKDSSYSVNFTARFQTLFTTNWDFPDDTELKNGKSAFLLRRARMKFDGFAYSPKLRYKIELGFSNNDLAGASVYNGNTPQYILDALIKWNFAKGFELWAGQTKLPGNRERLISSGSLEFVDRSLLNSRYNIDRDLGVQVHHTATIGKQFVIREIVAVSQGEGRGVTTGNQGGFQYTARLEALPFGDFSDYSGADMRREKTPKLALAASFDLNNDAVRSRSNIGEYLETDNGLFETNVYTIFVDAMFKYKGWSLMGEFANRSADNPIAVNLDGSPTGVAVNEGAAVNLQAGYLFKNNIELSGRYTMVDEKVTAAQHQITVGLSKYFVGHKLKLQTDLSLTDFDDNTKNGLMYRLQLDIQL